MSGVPKPPRPAPMPPPRPQPEPPRPAAHHGSPRFPMHTYAQTRHSLHQAIWEHHEKLMTDDTFELVTAKLTERIALFERMAHERAKLEKAAAAHAPTDPRLGQT